MSRCQNDPLRRLLTADERKELARLSRSPSALEPCWPLLTAPAPRLQLTKPDDGTPRPSRPGLAASTARGSPRCGRGMGAERAPAMALTRSNASWRNEREPDSTAAWTLSLLQKAFRRAPDGLPQVSTFTIWRTLHAAGLSWQNSRTWCQTGVAMRRRKHGVVRVSDPDARAKKS